MPRAAPPYGLRVSVVAPTLARLRRVRGQHATAVRWLGLVGPLLLVAVPVVAWQARPRPGLSGRPLLVTVCVTAFVVGALLRTLTARRRTGTAHRVAVALVVVGSATLTFAQPRGPGAECAVLGVLCVAVLLRGAAAAVVLIVGFAAVGFASWAVRPDGVALAVLACFAALYGLLYLAFRLVQANREAERLLVELDRNRAAQARAAGLAERAHIAREMHDVLAHSLSGLLLQLEGARMLAAGDPGDPRLPAAIERAHQLGKAGLDEARKAIGTLRDDQLPGPERLARLAADFERDRRVPCTLTVSGPPSRLEPQVQVALYRTAQEALTNVGRHAQAERVALCLEYSEHRVRLAVEDFGSAPSAPRGCGGYGLTGMRERAELLGGTLHAAATARGFRVELVVPTSGTHT